MDHLTSFEGGVTWGHVGLLIFHNSPFKTLGGPYTHLTHINTHLICQSVFELRLPPFDLEGNVTNLELMGYLLVVLAPGTAQAFENIHCHLASFPSLQQLPKLGRHPLTLSVSLPCSTLYLLLCGCFEII